jgi:hypothetical protein
MGSKSKAETLFLELLLFKQVSVAHFFNFGVKLLLEFQTNTPINREENQRKQEIGNPGLPAI